MPTNECPICLYKGLFRNFRGRQLAQCPKCASLERHRLTWLYWKQETNLLDGVTPKKMLHFAPEICFFGRLSHWPGVDYLSGDLAPGKRVMKRLDLTKLDLPSETFDVWHCSHVLEHIEDDRSAMKELYRVLKQGGWGLIQIPLRRGQHTYVEPSARTPELRKQYYGQHNHVRIYGELDLGPALESAGFKVQTIQYADKLPADLVTKYSVARDELLYLCQRPR